MHGAETKLQLHQISQFVTLQSCKNIAQHVGVLDNGQLKSALATHRNDNHAMFGVRLIVSVLQYFPLPIILSDFSAILWQKQVFFFYKWMKTL